MKFYQRKLGVKLKIIISVLLFFTLFGAVHAAEPSGAGNALNNFVLGVFYIILSISLSLLSALTESLNWAIQLQINTDLGAVQASWTIVRNFTNMFFIVIMIIMAFATIFDIQILGVSNNLRPVIVKFIIAAIFINFSLVIGGLVINGTQIINGVFLTSMGNMSDHLGQILKPSVLLGDLEQVLPSQIGNSWLGGMLGYIGVPGGQGIGDAITITGAKGDNLSFFIMLRIFFSAILALMVSFSLLTALIFAFLRIPIIWALLVISPLAWLASVLPSTRNLSERWWKHFISWNLFLPIFLFVLYFSLYFLTQQNALISSISKNVGEAALKSPGLATGFSFQYLLTYAMTAFFLITGTALAMSSSIFAGTGVVGMYQRARSIAWRLPGLSHARAVGEGAGEAAKYGYEKTLREGLFGFGGQQALERLRARSAQGFGAPGRREAQLKTEIKYFKEQFDKNNLDPSELRSIATSDKNNARRLAAYEILRDKKDIEPNELYEAYKLYGEGTISATEFAMKIDFEKDFDRGERAEWYDKVKNNDVKRKLAKAIAVQGEFRSMEDMKTAAELFKVDGVVDEKQGKIRDFLRKASEKNIVDAFTLAAQYKLLTKYNPVTKIEEQIDFEEAIKVEIGRKKGNDFFAFVSPDLYTPADGGRLKTDTEIKSDPKLGAKNKELITLRKLVLERLEKNPSLLEKLKRNPTSTTIQSEVLNAFDKEIKSRGGTPGSAPPSATGTTASINDNNLLDLRKI